MNSIRILITGQPGCGKTTLIKKVARSISIPFCGFFTNEIRKKGKRAGFEIESFAGNKAVMSHLDIKSSFRVGRYGVDIESIDRIAVFEVEIALSENRLLIVDEIGKMELFSERFRDLILKVFQREIPFVGTILYKPHPFCDRLKCSSGVKLLTLRKSNQDMACGKVVRWLENIHRN
jgi:nucleoside-triphosphatase